MADFAKLFLDYLKRQHGLRTCHITVLEPRYASFLCTPQGQSFRRVPFFEVVYGMENAEFPLLEVNNKGFVIFAKRVGERSKWINMLRNEETKQKMIHGNGSIEITCSSPECVTENGYFTFKIDEETASFTITIKNVSNTSVYLRKCLPLRDMEAFSFADQAHCTQLHRDHPMFKIKSNETYEIQVNCNIKEKVARYDTDLFFNFQTKTSTTEIFHMVRFLTCNKSNELVEKLQPTSKFTKREKSRRYQVWSRHRGEALVITGDKLEKVRRLRAYSVPKELSKAVTKRVFSNKAGQVSVKETEWRNLLQSNLTVSNYSTKFSLLLHLEEIQGEKDIRLYDLKQVSLEQTGGGGTRFWLKVPGLAEKRPSVIRGDSVLLYEVGPDGIHNGVENEGIVHEVHLERALLGLNQRFSFHKDMLFDVVFTFSRHQMRLQHRAVGDLLMKTHKHLLFPELIGHYDVKNLSLSMMNKNINNNPEQLKAVASIVCGNSRLPYVIYGPPGTGKTVTVVEAIKQVVHVKPEAHILVCSPSNSAADLLAERLLAHVHRDKMFRMCAQSREYTYTPKDVQPIVNYNAANHEFYFPPKSEISKYNIVLTTLITAGKIASAQFPADHFDYVFIDEAGYAAEPEFMNAVAGVLGPSGRVIMAGDPQQLGPVLYSSLAGLHGLELSYLERLFQFGIYQPNDNQEYDCRFITKLVKNYRSHQAILEIPNQCFYDNELEECADVSERTMLCSWEELPTPNFPIIFHSVKGKDLREANSPSYFNAEEAVVVVDYVEKLLAARGNGVTPRHIGIISPYRKQTSKIRQALKKAFPYRDLEGLKVGSVEEFQGQERRVIIISTVRSTNEHLKEDNKFRLGFLKNKKRFNVAITRAKSLLIVVGDPGILCSDHYWNIFINYCVDKGGFVGVPVDDKVLHPEDQDGDMELDDLLARFRELEIEDPAEERGSARPEE